MLVLFFAVDNFRLKPIFQIDTFKNSIDIRAWSLRNNFNKREKVQFQLNKTVALLEFTLLDVQQVSYFCMYWTHAFINGKRYQAFKRRVNRVYHGHKWVEYTGYWHDRTHQVCQNIFTYPTTQLREQRTFLSMWLFSTRQRLAFRDHENLYFPARPWIRLKPDLCEQCNLVHNIFLPRPGKLTWQLLTRVQSILDKFQIHFIHISSLMYPNTLIPSTMKPWSAVHSFAHYKQLPCGITRANVWNNLSQRIFSRPRNSSKELCYSLVNNLCLLIHLVEWNICPEASNDPASMSAIDLRWQFCPPTVFSSSEPNLVYGPRIFQTMWHKIRWH